jgi:hypothetical protein
MMHWQYDSLWAVGSVWAVDSVGKSGIRIRACGIGDGFPLVPVVRVLDPLAKFLADQKEQKSMLSTTTGMYP